MIFSTEENSSFNIPSRMFLNDYFYSFSKIGTFRINGIVGPDGGNSLSNSKEIAIKKSFSEMLERRLLMLGTENFEDSIKGIDIINRDKRNFLDGHIKFCNIHGIENDTTGTASHFVSEFAIVNAIKELFEKNSLFLFWFKQRGFKVSNSGNFINTYFKEKYKNIYLFLNDDFSPFICCTAFAIDKNEIIANGSGISFNLEFSIQNALEELDLLYEQKKINKIYSYISKSSLNDDDDDSANHMAQISYIKKLFLLLPEYNTKKNTIDIKEIRLKHIIENVPSWISNIYVFNISGSVNKNIKTVRVFSDDLNNLIPRKILTQRTNTINMLFKPNLGLKDTIPECPIL